MTLIPLSVRPSEATAPEAAPEAAAHPSGRRLGVLLALLLVVLGGAAYVYLPMLGLELPSLDLAWLGELSATTGLPTVTLVAVPVGLAVLVLLVVVRRSRPGAKTDGSSDAQETVATDDADQEPVASPAPAAPRPSSSRPETGLDAEAAPTPEADPEAEPASDPEPRPRRRLSLRRRTRPAVEETPPLSRTPDDLVPEMDPRALLMYARSLEGTLNDQEDRLEQVRQAADERHRAELERDHEKVRATVDVMRRVHAQQPGVVALGRTEAAVARLGVEPGFARPLLPSGPAGTLPVTFGIAPVPEPTPTATDEAAPQPSPAPPAVTGSLVEREAALSAEPVPVELTAAGRPKVRPVPPPPETAPTRRGRLRRRGSRS